MGDQCVITRTVKVGAGGPAELHRVAEYLWRAPGLPAVKRGRESDTHRRVEARTREPEAEQFALDPPVSPVRVLPRRALNGRCELGVGWRPAGSSRAKAASTARSADSSFGFGFGRRSTATSWRRTSSSASFEAVERATRVIQPVRRTKIR